jgi:fermentation-respiration switch protein FrsA (DUF1100 family)
MDKVSFFEQLARIARILVFAYLAVLALARIFESHLIFFPNEPNRLDGDWHPQGLPIEDVWLRTSDDVTLHAWWIPAENAKFTFLAFHGNAGNIANRADVYRFLRDTPANVLAVEYRGYGRSQGSPSETGLYRDSDAAYQYLGQTRRIVPRTIISFGQSLGSAVAAHLAANAEVGGVILEAPFPSLRAMARRVFWFLPGIELTVLTQFQTSMYITRANAPVLVVHCAQDTVIPPELEERVYDAAKAPKFVLQVNDRCHEEASLMAPGRYRAALQPFLTAVDAAAKHY